MQGEEDLGSESEPDLDYELVEDIQGRMILHWNYRSLKEIPLEVLDFGDHIQEMYLKRNCLEKLPTDIGKLRNLTNLYLVGNQLEGLPAQISDLKSLRVLDVSQNYIKRLPSSVGELESLESLLVSCNRLEDMPKCVKKLHNLKFLELSGNMIRSLPADVFEDSLQSLEEFGVDANPITAIPRNICLLPNLWYFSACRCNLLLLPSLPFHKLMHASCNIRKHSSNLGNGGFNKSLQFLFDGNNCLNYIPYWVLQLLGTSVKCYGTNAQPVDVLLGALANGNYPHETTPDESESTYPYRDIRRPMIQINFKGQRRTLHFDEDLKHLHHLNQSSNEAEGIVKVKVPSLFELSLRLIYHHSLLNMTLDQCGVKEVQEPLIVPQKAGEPSQPQQGAAGVTEEEKKNDGNPESEVELSGTDNPASPQSPEVAVGTDDEIKLEVEIEDAHLASVSRPIPNTFPGTYLSNLLPPNLRRLLKKGPVTRCFECLCPIFTETWPIIFHISRWAYIEAPPPRRMRNVNEANLIGDILDNLLVDGKISIGCLYFCGGSCQELFRRSVQTAKITRFPIHDLKYIIDNEIPWIKV